MKRSFLKAILLTVLDFLVLWGIFYFGHVLNINLLDDTSNWYDAPYFVTSLFVFIGLTVAVGFSWGNAVGEDII